jgi:hypothetical protein
MNAVCKDGGPNNNNTNHIGTVKYQLITRCDYCETMTEEGSLKRRSNTEMSSVFFSCAVSSSSSALQLLQSPGLP